MGEKSRSARGCAPFYFLSSWLVRASTLHKINKWNSKREVKSRESLGVVHLLFSFIRLIQALTFHKNKINEIQNFFKKVFQGLWGWNGRGQVGVVHFYFLFIRLIRASPLLGTERLRMLFTVGLTQLRYHLCSLIERFRVRKSTVVLFAIQVAFHGTRVARLDFLCPCICFMEISCMISCNPKLKLVHALLVWHSFKVFPCI